MAERHRAPNNRNIWSSRLADSFVCPGEPPLYTTYMYACMYMYMCMYVCIYMRVCMYVCVHVYVCMHNISGRELSGGSKCPTQNGRGNCPGNCPGVNCPGELSVGIVLHPQLNEAH